MKKLMVILLSVMILIPSLKVDAEDNADTGDGGTDVAVTEKGYYRTSEYMYKVSIYVGASDVADENGSLTGWHQIGTKEIYVKPTTFTIPTNTIGGNGSKIDYQKGSLLSPIRIDRVVNDNPPPIPITHGGNIESVRSYFGDTATLNMLINEYALQLGVDRESLVSGLKFTIKGVTGYYPPSEILPIKVNGSYQNKVPWLVIYEPVVLTHLKDGTTVLAFTATEYALAQKLGYFNFRSGTDGQYVSAMTHSDLPNSIFLESGWFGYPVTAALLDGVYWSEDRIIQGGGWGMRMLRPTSEDVVINDTTYDQEYRVDTDVITSVRIYATEDITPDDRHVSETAYKNPKSNTATVTMTANGQMKRTEIVLPKGGSELVWIKWHTPLAPSTTSVQVQITGNPAAFIEGGHRSSVITAKIVDLGANVPPDPKANDRNDGFILPTIPIKANKTSAQWGIYSSTWAPDWHWHAKWEWDSDWQYFAHYGWVMTATGMKWQYVGSFWEDHGQWVDNGRWVDEGEWVYQYTSYHASLSATMELSPDTKVPTAIGDTMRSGYGLNESVTSTIYSNAPSSHLTYAQNAISYFPEFNYKTYWRSLEHRGNGTFTFKVNKYSTYNDRTHFTPIWFPDGEYKVYTELIDCWTPEGMLRLNLSDPVIIDGNLYQDWHIAPLGE